MAIQKFVGLDSPLFAGRLRGYEVRETAYHSRQTSKKPGEMITDVADPLRPKAFARPVEDLVIQKQLEATEPTPTVEIKQPQASLEAELPYKVIEPVRPKNFAPPVVPRRKRSAVLRRSLAKKPVQKRAKLSFNLKSRMLTAMAVVLFLLGTTVSIITFKTNKQTTAQVQAMGQQSQRTEGPDEEEDTSPLSAYQVAPAMPRFIRIAKIGVQARVKPIGVKKNNELEAPRSIFDTGWYNASSKPGEAGAALIDAHVSGPTKPGVFKNLKQVNQGDLIEIERGDGQKLTFKVVKTAVFDAKSADMASMLLSADPTKPGLNLMTCTGQFDAKTNSYPQRLAVYAVRV